MKKCEEWLERNHKEMHERLYSQGVFCFLEIGAVFPCTVHRLGTSFLSVVLARVSAQAKES